ncbi:MAG: hypothetical protein KUL75_06360 [Sterolibacterium sp.]|nr:hypothetical protein [Sterolibacterium sp.]
MQQQINLINPALRKTRDLLSAMPLAMVVGLLLILIMAGGSFARQRATAAQVEADKRTAELTAAQAQLMELSGKTSEGAVDPVLAEELTNSRAMLNLREEVIATLERGVFTGNTGFAEFLRGFARQAPSGLWLTGFVLNPVDRNIEIRGRMLKATALPEFVQRLKSEDVFRGMSFSSLEIDRPERAGAEETDQADGFTADSAMRQAAEKLPDYSEFVMRTTPAGTATSKIEDDVPRRAARLEIRQ